MIRYDNDCNGISKETLTSKKWQTCAACLIHVHSSAKDAIKSSKITCRIFRRRKNN